MYAAAGRGGLKFSFPDINRYACELENMIQFGKFTAGVKNQG
jgi:hypothetical protein